MGCDHSAGVKGGHQTYGRRRQIATERYILCYSHRPTTRPLPRRVATARDFQRRGLLCMLDHPRCRNCTIGLSGLRLCHSGLWGTASGDVVPGGLRHGRVAQCDSTVPRDQSSPTRGCGRPVATAPPQTVSRLQPRFAPDGEILLRPGVGEGRNNMLKRSWCASPVFESVHARLGASRVIEDRSDGLHYRGEERRVTRRAATPCHVIRGAVLYAYGDVLV
jgi:hypothetical protein